jgi:magnesium chelatase family protein
MSVARVASRAQLGLAAPRVDVEVHLGGGLPQFSIVGLPATAVKESKDRVRAALANANFEWPAGRITVNLSPADLPKEGCRYDLPIALGILLASSQLPCDAQRLDGWEFYGELGLAGELKPIRGMVLAAAHAARDGHRMLVPAANLAEARSPRGLRHSALPACSTCAHYSAVHQRVLPMPTNCSRRSHCNPAPRILPTCAAKPPPSARCWWRPPAGTASCSWVPRAPARPCWRSACPGCCRHWWAPMRSTSPRLPR